MDVPLSAEAVERVEKVGHTISFPLTHVLCVKTRCSFSKRACLRVCLADPHSTWLPSMRNRHNTHTSLS